MNDKREITIFTDITTESILTELEVEAKSYEGLYVDMDNKDERKYVKDKAALISVLLKKLNRARIDESFRYKTLVESEASSIKERLEGANKPFTLLIDEHKEKRAKELAIEKALQDAKDLAYQLPIDHESAIMEDKVRTLEIQEAEQARIDHEEKLKADAIKGAEERQRLAVAQAKQDVIDQQAKKEADEKAELERRGADINHKAKVNNSILDSLINHGFSVEDSKKFIKLAARNQLPNIRINY